MKLKGSIVSSSGKFVDGYAEIVHIDVFGNVLSYAVHLYYMDGIKRVYKNIGGGLTKRYSFSFTQIGDIYRDCYNNLLQQDEFIDFVLIED